jgi:hypothetical protein
MRKLLALLTTGALLMLAGCPRPAVETTTAVDTPGADPAVATTDTAPADPGTVNIDVDVDASQTASSTKTDAAAATPSKAQLEGSWFCLYGRSSMGWGTFTYEDGHRLEFMPNGGALFILTGDGGQQLASNWSLAGRKLELTVAEKAEGELGEFGKVTPLAFGRDSEIGLTNAGRDGEIGLGADGKPAAQTMVFHFEPSLMGPFLVLEASSGELMVYGREDNPHAGGMPQVEGTWTLTPAVGQTYDVELKPAGNRLALNWGPQRSQMDARFTHGYFVGLVNSTAGSAYAAFTPASDGSLDGVITPEPFLEVLPTFDLVRK